MSDRLEGYRNATDEDAIFRRAAAEALKEDERFHQLSVMIEADIRYESPLVYLMATAHHSAVNALSELAECDLGDIDKIRQLQNDIQRYRDMVSWLVGAVNQGRAAYQRVPPEVQQGWIEALAGNGQDV